MVILVAAHISGSTESASPYAVERLVDTRCDLAITVYAADRKGGPEAADLAAP